jgi:hypothetical protein
MKPDADLSVLTMVGMAGVTIVRSRADSRHERQSDIMVRAVVVLMGRGTPGGVVVACAPLALSAPVRVSEVLLFATSFVAENDETWVISRVVDIVEKWVGRGWKSDCGEISKAAR